MNILLIQFRTDQSALHEQECVLRRGKLIPDELIVVNPLLNPDQLRNLRVCDLDGVIVGGSGELYVSNPMPQLTQAMTLVRPIFDDVLKHEHPYLGLCFGHQLMADYLGGKVTAMSAGPVSGTRQIALTRQGQEHPIFADLPEIFLAQHGHRDSVVAAPFGATVLVTSAHDPHAALAYGPAAIGVQFHPELDAEDIAFRLSLYPNYAAGESQQRILDGTQASPEAPKVLRNFVKRCRIAGERR